MKSAPYDVVAFGEILWDFQATPEDGPDRYVRVPGGASANVAAALATQGVRVALAGGVGRDLFGDELLARLSALGVECQEIRRFSEKTGITFVARNAEGQPRFVMYRWQTADSAFMARHVTRAITSARWTQIGTSTLSNPTVAEATVRLVERVSARDGQLSIDLNARPNLWQSRPLVHRTLRKILPRCALIKASEFDLAKLEWDVARLRKLAPRATVILTRGEKGASAHGEHGRVSRPAKKARCVDATGAGDAFVAGVLSLLLERNVMPSSPAWKSETFWTEALDKGHSLGARAVTKIGAMGWLLEV